MGLTESQFLDLEGNIRTVWDAYFKKEDIYMDPYNVIKDKTAQITDISVGAMGQMTEWAGTVAYDDFAQGYSKQVHPTKYSTGVQIDADLVADKEYRQIKTRVTNVMHGVIKTLRNETAAIFEGAFGTTYTGADSAGLCSASHYIASTGETAQSNTNTLSLTYTNLETSQKNMEAFVDDREDKMLVRGDMVIAGPALRKTCQKLFGSEQEAYTADNTINVDKDFKFFIHPLITSYKWFLVSEDAMKSGSGLNFWMREDPRKLERDGAVAAGDFNTEVISWKAVGRWIKYWHSWYWCYGNNATS